MDKFLLRYLSPLKKLLSSSSLMFHRPETDAPEQCGVYPESTGLVTDLSRNEELTSEGAPF